MKQLFENGNGWRTLAIAIGIVITVTTIANWRTLAEARVEFATKSELKVAEVRWRDSFLDVKADLREIKFDIKEILKTR